MLTILKDAENYPNLFQWFGGIALEQIESWMRSYPLTVPSDLLEFWRQTGGGDLFESETMFRPTLAPGPCPYLIDGDDVLSASQFRIHNGMSPSYLVFHEGLFLSVIHLHKQLFVTLDRKFQETAVFATFEEWYTRALRKEYGRRYGLRMETEGS